MKNPPLITFWVTSVGREYVADCVNSIVEKCKYPNYRLLIYESKPDNEFNTVELFNSLNCEKTIWLNEKKEFPSLGWIYNLFMKHTEDFYIRLDDDTVLYDDPTEMLYEAIEFLYEQPLPFPVSHVAVESNPRIGYDMEKNIATKKVREDGAFLGMYETKHSPVLCFAYHPGLSLVKKSFVPPWDEKVYWRNVESVHIKTLITKKIRAVYFLKWWGFWGHFGTVAVDNIDRTKNTISCQYYYDNGYYGERPKETWATVCNV